MDIRCPKCGEPWEIDTLHEEVESRYPDKPWKVNGVHDQKKYDPFFNEVRKEFSLKGCTTFGSQHGEIAPKNAIFGELMELAGDDIDFAASMIEDAETFGLLD